MSIGQTIAGLVGIGVAAQAALLGVGALIEEPPFMTVHRMEVIGGQVEVRRRVNYQVVADWRVTVVSDRRDGPYCQTIPGPEPDQGWSNYLPNEGEKSMPLDVWVWDIGCFERLEPGAHYMLVTWTPRDGTSPVVARHDFTVEASNDS